MKKLLSHSQFSKFKRLYHLLPATGLLFLLVFAMSTALSYRQRTADAIDPALVGNDMVSTWDRRMRKIIPDLPGHGAVGYLADWDIPDAQFGYNDQLVEYLLTQYSLAPVTLQRGANYPVIIGNFSDQGDPAKIPTVLKMFNLQIIKQHTNEIFILKGLVQ